MIKKNRRLDFGYDFIPYLIKTGRPVYGYVLKGGWYDVGTPQRYLKAMKDMLYGKVSSLRDFGGRLSPDTHIWVQGESPGSIIRRKKIVRKIKQGKIAVEGAVLIGRHCEIRDGVRIKDSCIDNYTKIGKNVVIENSAIMDRVIIGDNAVIKNSIVARHATILSTTKKPTKISGVSVIADDVTIAEGSELKATKVYPHLYVKGKYANKIIMH